MSVKVVDEWEILCFSEKNWKDNQSWLREPKFILYLSELFIQCNNEAIHWIVWHDMFEEFLNRSWKKSKLLKMMIKINFLKNGTFESSHNLTFPGKFQKQGNDSKNGVRFLRRSFMFFEEKMPNITVFLNNFAIMLSFFKQLFHFCTK